MGERKGGARKRKVLALRTAARHLLGSVARAVDLLTRSSLLPSCDVPPSSVSATASSADQHRVSPTTSGIAEKPLPAASPPWSSVRFEMMSPPSRRLDAAN